ncbi:MAG: hypothetical protein AAFS10_01345, partial [Myxococcota bacterium]
CEDNACVLRPVAGCCTDNAECDDGDACTADRCDRAVCRHDYMGGEGCCEEDAECDDGDLCTADRCEAHACTAQPIEGCCEEDGECDDGDVCTSDLCHNNQCHYATLPACVDADAGEEPDTTPEPDTTVPEPDVPDSAETDTTAPDSAEADTAPDDGDAAPDTEVSPEGGGCDGCRTTQGRSRGWAIWPWLMALGWVIGRRR